MEPRYANAIELARETTARLLERLAGSAAPTGPCRGPTSTDLAVFNPSPFPRTDVVRFPLDGVPTFLVTDDNADIHPLAVASLMRQGFTVDGQPVRMVPVEDTNRFRVLPEQVPADVEFVVTDIPAFGWRRVHLEPADAAPDHVDDGADDHDRRGLGDRRGGRDARRPDGGAPVGAPRRSRGSRRLGGHLRLRRPA